MVKNTAPNMADFEKLGTFYLGRRRDPESSQTTDELVLYDSADLVTHALIVGMTGSGKTGLGIALIEEAAIDGIPSILIDPKGDLTNLLLTFPSLSSSDFAPWVNPDDAARENSSVEAFAAREAERWTRGLAGWGEDGARIQRLRDAAAFTVYTPGSTAGAPVSVLGSFDPPRSDDPEVVSDRIASTVSGLLTLVGVEADPLRSREHMLLSTIIAEAWGRGAGLDVASLVQSVQYPPVAQIGVIDVDSFFPPKDRFELGMILNALLASPRFEPWTIGDSLDVESLLRTEAGRPRVSIFTLAHLDDSQRMFFVTQLLSAVTAWMRGQRGTSSLRALLYMDEIAGFFPPVANPPSKPPLLTLLKQGRAHGLGVALATQNPADLDYKGLSNIGTWFLGRLQTERDKARVLDGLEGADAGGPLDRASVDRLLSELTSRVFLMRNVHEPGLTLFETRWTLSYLRGPLGRNEIKKLASADATSSRGSAADEGRSVPASPPAPAPISSPDTAPSVSAGDRTVVPPDVPQYFVADETSLDRPWRPILYGAAEVRFVDRSLKVNESRLVAKIAPVTDGAVPVDWEESLPTNVTPDQLASGPPPEGAFEPLPTAAAKAKHYPTWSKQLAAWLTANETIELMRSPGTGDVSHPGESEREFRGRAQHAAREARDKALEALRRKYAPKQRALAERLRRAEQALERESHQASGQRMQTVISFGATVMGAILGRKAASIGNIGRATTAARGVGRSMKEAQDVARAQETVGAVGEQQRRLEEDFEADTAALASPTDVVTEALDQVSVPLKKSNVDVKLVALVWTKTPPPGR